MWVCMHVESRKRRHESLVGDCISILFDSVTPNLCGELT